MFAQHRATTETDLVELTVAGDEGPSRSTANGTTSAVSPAVAKSADQARPPGYAHNSATAESERALSSDEAGLSGLTANCTTSAEVAAVAISAEVPRPHHSATTQSELPVSSDEAGLSRSRTIGMTSDIITTLTEIADESQPSHKRAIIDGLQKLHRRQCGRSHCRRGGRSEFQ